MWLLNFLTGLIFTQNRLLVARADDRSNNKNEDYNFVTENRLRMPPLSGHGDIWLSWTDDLHCPPGTFISAYKATYSEANGYLVHFAVACSELAAELKVTKPVQFLNVGVPSHEKTFSEKDLSSFVSSTSSGAKDSYAIDAAWSTYQHRKNKKRGTGVIGGEVELIFQNDWSFKKQKQVDAPISYWIEDQMYYGVCTKDFALCGMRAELHHAQYRGDIEAHIRRLSFLCCYVCKAEVAHIHLKTVTTRSNGEDRRGAVVPVPFGIEFAAPDDEQGKGQVSAEVKDQSFYCMEDAEKGIQDTFEEFQRESACITTTANNGVAPPATDPLLEYRYSLPLAVRFHHSSFGAQISFQPGLLELSDGIASQFLPSSSCTTAAMAAGKYSCRYESRSGPRSASVPPNDGPALSGSSSWESSAILRTVYQGARNLLTLFHHQRRLEELHEGQVGCYPGATDSASAGPEEIPERAQALHLTMENFTCDGDEGVNSCSGYQVVEKCGAVRVYSPRFLILSRSHPS